MLNGKPMYRLTGMMKVYVSFRYHFPILLLACVVPQGQFGVADTLVVTNIINLQYNRRISRLWGWNSGGKTRCGGPFLTAVVSYPSHFCSPDRFSHSNAGCHCAVHSILFETGHGQDIGCTLSNHLLGPSFAR